MIIRVASFLFLLFAFNLISAQTQETYRIIPSNSMDVVKLKQALAMCDLDPYRKENTKVTMLFKDGTKVELFSANTLKLKGLAFNENEINRSPFLLSNLFELKDAGYITEEVKTLDKRTMAKQRRDK